MNNELNLSEKSKSFLENLNLYLFSKGKKSEEIEEIIEELETHLYEAEKNGKPIEKIIGKSPKEYMETVSYEMNIDYRTWLKYITLIIFGSFSFTIFQDLLKGNLSYSVLEIGGHIVIGIIFIISVLKGFKYMSTTTQSIKIQGLVLFTIAILPIILFVALIYLNRAVETPSITLGHTASLIVGIVTGLLIIGVSFWSKTWILIIISLLLTMPDYLLSLTPLEYKTQVLLSPWITFAGIAIYIFAVIKLEKKKKSLGTDL